RNRRGVPDDRYDIPMPAHLGAQNAEAVLGIVVGDAFDEAGQNFLVWRFRLRLHVVVISWTMRQLIVVEQEASFDARAFDRRLRERMAWNVDYCKSLLS